MENSPMTTTTMVKLQSDIQLSFHFASAGIVLIIRDNNDMPIYADESMWET